VPLVGPKTSCLNCRIRSSKVSLFRRKEKDDITPHSDVKKGTRRNFLNTATVAVATIPLQSSAASTYTDKQLNLSNEELKK